MKKIYLTKEQQDGVRTFYYQVCNGGMSQYIFNGGYESIPALIEAMDLIKENYTSMEKETNAINKIMNMMKETTIFLEPEDYVEYCETCEDDEEECDEWHDNEMDVESIDLIDMDKDCGFDRQNTTMCGWHDDTFYKHDWVLEKVLEDHNQDTSISYFQQFMKRI